MNKNIIKFGMFFLIGILLINFISSYSSSNPNYGLFDSYVRGSFVDTIDCENGQDFLIQIAPFACEPAVVRSDLLEEQNVPIFCQLGATKINPLIDVEAIDSISFSGNYPPEVSGIGFHPAKAALGIKDKINNPILDNIGYVVIILKEQENESAMPDYIQGNLTAHIKYDIKNAFGIGKAVFYIPELDDSEWQEQKEVYSFWNGKFYVKVDSMTSKGARISLYNDLEKLSSVDLKKGEISRKIPIPGFVCDSNLQLKLEELTASDTRARIEINGKIYEVVEGEKFLDNACYIKDIKINGLFKSVQISCRDNEEDSFSRKTFELEINPSVKLEINNKEKILNTGDFIDKRKEIVLKQIKLKNSDSDNEGNLQIIVGKSNNDKDKRTIGFEEEKAIEGINIKLLGYGFEDDEEEQKTSYSVTGSIIKNPITGKSFSDKVNNVFDNQIIIDNQDDSITQNSEIKKSVKNALNYLVNKFGEPFYNKNVKIIVKASVDANTYFYEDSREIKISSLDITSSNDDKLVHELFHAFYQSDKLIQEKKDLFLEGTATYAEMYYECNVKNRCNGKKFKEHVSSNLKAYEDNAPGDKNKKFSEYNEEEKDYMYYYAVSQYIDFTPDKIRNLLDDSKITSFKDINSDKESDSNSITTLSKTTSEYYNKAESDFNVLINNYKNEKIFESDSSAFLFGYTNKIRLSYKLGLRSKTYEFCQELKKKYFKEFEELKTIDYNTYNQINSYCSQASLANSGNNYIEKSINGVISSIRLVDIYSPSAEDYSAELIINDKTRKLSKEAEINLEDNQFIRLIELDDNSARIYYNIKDGDSYDKDYITLIKDEKIGIGESSVKLTKTNIKKIAKISVIPNIDNSGTSAEFPFKIGIEKRAISLSPEKAKKKINNLNNTINKWKKRSESLGNLVQGMKGACLATETYLTIKNFFQNTGGKALARQDIMRSENGFREQCEELSGEGEKYERIEECFSDKAEEIENAVNERYSAMQKQQTLLKQIDEKCKTDKGFLGEQEINTDCFIEEFIPKAKSSVNAISNKIKISNLRADDTINDVINMIDKDRLSKEQLRQIDLNARILKNNPNNKIAKIQLENSLSELYNNYYDEKEKETLARSFNIKKALYGSDPNKKTQQFSITKDIKWSEISAHFSYENIDANSLVQIYGDKLEGGQSYLLVLNDDYVVEKTYKIEKGALGKYNLVEQDSANPKNIEIKKYDKETYNNAFKIPPKPEIKFYETEPNAGSPALVPFDLDKGWYVSIKHSTGAFGGSLSGNLQSYDESGYPKSYLICNVGENGKIDDYGTNSDECVGINTASRTAYFEGLDETQRKKLVRCAENAILDASRQYGKKKIDISTSCDSFSIDVGSPAIDTPALECNDIMSQKDCELLFNLCDPVICPSSRCDFGGAYPVKDVIQSGIVGSLMLCYPNAKWHGGEVYLPVCLTGIKAGIDGYLSVLTSYRDCLEESVKEGKMVGICDEIYSIHLCEFFWRQGLPLAKIALPKLMEIALGQNIRGGGEYLGVSSAWQNAQKSIDYFTNYYAANSFQAFKKRTTEDVGGEVCKNFASGVYPENGDVLDALTTPDSPPQFHGRFDEIPFTDATVPPISQYKVFYHIYAGQDSRAYYKVYLKGGSESSYYQDSGQIKLIDSGYISKSEYASETKDFTAPSGYTELCIRVNNQEECGFKQVSTSFGVNYVEDKYLENIAKQGKQDINSEKECVSGNPSLYSLSNINLQSSAEEMINPEIYKRGITRVCSTNNPGLGTDSKTNTEDARWVNVGWCDKNKKIRCWLDRNSVKDVIENKNIEKEFLEETNLENQKYLQQEDAYEDEADINELIKELYNKYEPEYGFPDPEDIISDINNVIDKTFWNNQKAYLYLFRGKAYSQLAVWKYLENLEIEEDPIEDEFSKEENGEEKPDQEKVKEVVTLKLEDVERSSIKLFNAAKNLGYSKCSSNYFGFINEYAKENNIPDPMILVALMLQESSCDRGANSENSNFGFEDGASYGLMQISGKTWCSKKDLSDNNEDCKKILLTNPEKNIKLGAEILKDYYDQHKKGKEFTGACTNEYQEIIYKEWAAALRAYNGWSCNSAFSQQDKFVDDVIEIYDNLESEYNKLEKESSEKNSEKEYTKCEDCGKGFFNFCNKKECNKIEEYLKDNNNFDGSCVFEEEFFLNGGNKCVSAGKIEEVDDLESFVSAIKPNSYILIKDSVNEIILNPKEMSFDELNNLYGKSEGDYVYWQDDGYNQPELVINGVDNLVIEGESKDKEDLIKLYSDISTSNVIKFLNCNNLELKNLLLDHKSPYGCESFVLGIFGSENIKIINSVIKGSGEGGLELSNVKDFLFERSVIEECTEYILSISNSENIDFIFSKFKNNIIFDIRHRRGKSNIAGIYIYDSRNVFFTNSLFESNNENENNLDFSYLFSLEYDSGSNNLPYVEVKDCVFKKNQLDYFVGIQGMTLNDLKKSFKLKGKNFVRDQKDYFPQSSIDQYKE